MMEAQWLAHAERLAKIRAQRLAKVANSPSILRC